MTVELENIAQQLLDEARKAGAESADTIVAQSSNIEVDVRNGRLENVERTEGINAGLRVLIGQRQACVSGSDLTKDSITAMAEQSVYMAKASPIDRHSGLACPDQLAKNTDTHFLELIDTSEQLSLEHLKELAAEAELAAIEVPLVSQCDSAGAGCGTKTICVAGSHGFQGSYKKSMTSVYCSAISGQESQMEVDYCSESRVFASDLPKPAEIGELAGERVAAKAGSSRPPTGSYPVLFDERCSSSLIGHILLAINGSEISRGSSWLLDAKGSLILPEGVSIIEDPLLARHHSSRPFDAEGLPTSKRHIVENGILNNWILDLATARKLGLQSTANASRGLSSPPSPAVTNIVFPDGDKSREDLIKDLGTGLIVSSLIGSTINPVTGDYSRGAYGFWVENGEVTRPVSELTIAGNLMQFLKSIIPANDSRPFKKYRVPSLLVEGLTIAGA